MSGTRSIGYRPLVCGLRFSEATSFSVEHGNRAHVNVDDVFRDETRAAFESSSFPICICDEGSDQDCPSLRRRPSMVTVRKEIVPGLVESGGSRLSARYATCSC